MHQKPEVVTKLGSAENLEDRYEALLELEPFVVSGDAPTLSFGINTLLNRF